MLIQLLELLKSGEPYTVQELAELTGTDAASVKAEIEYLEHTGYIKPSSIKKEETKKHNACNHHCKGCNGCIRE
nr:hypothetical protein [uncultured Treponema sp.]